MQAGDRIVGPLCAVVRNLGLIPVVLGILCRFLRRVVMQQICTLERLKLDGSSKAGTRGPSQVYCTVLGVGTEPGRPRGAADGLGS